MVYYSTDLISLFSSEDAEAEENEEKQEKKEQQKKDDKLPVDLQSIKIHNLQLLGNIVYTDDIISVHHPDISTPPPKSSSHLI